MLELSHVTSYYGKTPIIQDLSLALAKGDLLAVIGRNGVGKTTLARTLLGLTTRISGSIRIEGVDIAQWPSHKRAAHGVGYIPQGRGILPKFTVRENILLGTFARSDGGRGIPANVLDLFPYLAENLDKRAGTLSGGQAQQLAIARALATDPKLLILDEPTEGIQPNIVEQIQDLVIRLNRSLGLTVILIEQNVEFAQRAANRFAVMDKGAIAVEGAIGDLTDEMIHKHLTI
ncbi:MAG: urea ABC transporter ATP-binding subunit UrtE [Betaproteobacteria bacterium]|nr:urea ABC transporter ATP-binding subunit UrtE [Betaproteobacteria bacterium]MBL8533338.1 urea ABC transporter ATP-binding subunit UrtE [Betaproteobacteria bacterium]